MTYQERQQAKEDLWTIQDQAWQLTRVDLIDRLEFCQFPEHIWVHPELQALLDRNTAQNAHLQLTIAWQKAWRPS